MGSCQLGIKTREWLCQFRPEVCPAQYLISSGASGRLRGQSCRQGMHAAVAHQNILPGSHGLWLTDFLRCSVSLCSAAFDRHYKCVTKSCLGICPTRKLVCVLGHSWSLNPVCPTRKHTYVCGLGERRSLNLVNHCEAWSACPDTAVFVDNGVKIHAHVVFSKMLRERKSFSKKIIIICIDVTPLFSGFESWTLHRFWSLELQVPPDGSPCLVHNIRPSSGTEHCGTLAPIISCKLSEKESPVEADSYQGES